MKKLLKKSAPTPEVAAKKTLLKPGKKPSGGFKFSDWPNTDYELIETTVEGPSYPRVSRFVVPGTMRKVFKDDRPTHAFMTVMPDGLRVAWDSCGYCINWVGACVCKNGVSSPRSVEYIYDSIVAHLAGEEWTPHHPNYKVGVVQKMRRGESTTTRLRMPTTQETEPPRKLLAKKSNSEPLPEEAFDNAKLRKAAKGLAKTAEKSMNQKLKKLEGAGKSKMLKRKS